MRTIVRRIFDVFSPWQPISPLATVASSEMFIHLDPDVSTDLTLRYDPGAVGLTITGEAKGKAGTGLMLTNAQGIAYLAIARESTAQPSRSSRENDVHMGGPMRQRPSTLADSAPIKGTAAKGGRTVMSAVLSPANESHRFEAERPRLSLTVTSSAPVVVRVYRS